LVAAHPHERDWEEEQDGRDAEQLVGAPKPPSAPIPSLPSAVRTPDIGLIAHQPGAVRTPDIGLVTHQPGAAPTPDIGLVTHLLAAAPTPDIGLVTHLLRAVLRSWHR
jgi:hypothetical protein